EARREGDVGLEHRPANVLQVDKCHGVLLFDTFSRKGRFDELLWRSIPPGNSVEKGDGCFNATQLYHTGWKKSSSFATALHRPDQTPGAAIQGEPAADPPAA